MIVIYDEKMAMWKLDGKFSAKVYSVFIKKPLQVMDEWCYELTVRADSPEEAERIGQAICDEQPEKQLSVMCVLNEKRV